MPLLSLNSWSLHRNLGPLHWTRWDEEQQTHRIEIQEAPELTSLLELPAVLASKGFSALEVCHFNFPQTTEAYLHELKEAFRSAGIRFYALLVDYGDISSADPIRRDADVAYVKQWIDSAAAAGAERVRVIAGDAEPTDTAALARSIASLQELCGYGAARGVRIVTENFRPLTSTSANAVALLEACGEQLGLISDFGNFKGPDKFDELAITVPRSESIHAKAQTDEHGMPDEAEYERCLSIVRDSGYTGPIALVYDGPHDMWEGIDRVKAIATKYL
jgi:sugar phosphate isomerase/epimerase